jgi:hypothetical protein
MQMTGITVLVSLGASRLHNVELPVALSSRFGMHVAS